MYFGKRRPDRHRCGGQASGFHGGESAAARLSAYHASYIRRRSVDAPSGKSLSGRTACPGKILSDFGGRTSKSGHSRSGGSLQEESEYLYGMLPCGPASFGGHFPVFLGNSHSGGSGADGATNL